MVMELACIKGEPVVLRDTRSQVFIGEVKAINEKLGRIVLKDLVQLPGRIAISGYRNFDRNEIVEIRSANFEEINGDTVEISGSESDMHSQTTPITMQPSELQEAKKVEYTFIKDFGSAFHSAILTLQNSSKIGLMALDTSKGRHKRASVVAVSTSTEVFIFDLLLMGDDLFVDGLGDVLQTPKIEKIVHDSRLLSDCLKQKHAVSLENVRDVEAEDIMVVHQDRKIIRRHRRTLEYLIGVYLGVDLRGLDKDEVWNDRPLKETQLDDLAKVISYLIPLQEAVERKYLKRLISASHVYNTHVRELDLFDFMHYIHEYTLKKELTKIIASKGDIRGEFRPQRLPEPGSCG